MNLFVLYNFEKNISVRL